MQFHQQTLANGLQLIGETSPSARSVALGYFVKTGSRDETPEVAGVSHFLEHMMFKGTPNRTAIDVNLDFDRIGASYNAYTSEENTVYYAAILPEYLPRAVEILSDILRPSLRSEDFDVEKQVILEEIGMYEDQPGWAAGDHARKIYYAKHPLGNSVLGSKESVSALSRDQMHGYFIRRYSPNNIILSIAGNFDWDAVVKMVGEATVKWQPGESGRGNRTEWGGVGGLHVLTRQKVQQEHVMLLAGGPAADSQLRYAADTLALAVGDESGSRLYWALVDPGLAESADCAFSESDGNGCVYASYSCEPEETDSNLDIVREVLDDVQEHGISADELQQAKNKIASRVVRGSERPMGRMQAIAASWTYTGEYRDVDRELSNFDSIELEDIRAFLDRYPINKSTVIGFGPLEEIKGVKGRVV